jgi:hypothetical protein
MVRLSIHHYICHHDKEKNKMTEIGKRLYNFLVVYAKAIIMLKK